MLRVKFEHWATRRMEPSQPCNVNERTEATKFLWKLPEVDPRRYSYQRFGESELVC